MCATWMGNARGIRSRPSIPAVFLLVHLGSPWNAALTFKKKSGRLPPRKKVALTSNFRQIQVTREEPRKKDERYDQYCRATFQISRSMARLPDHFFQGKLFKSTLNNRLCSNLSCVIDESSRGVKLKRAFEELPKIQVSPVDGRKTLILDLRPVEGSMPICSRCRHEAPLVHSYVSRRIKECSLLGYFVALNVTFRRVDCLHCKGHPMEAVEWLAPFKRHTERLREHVEHRTLEETVAYAAQETNLSWDTVKEIDKARLRRL